MAQPVIQLAWGGLESSHLEFGLTEPYVGSYALSDRLSKIEDLIPKRTFDLLGLDPIGRRIAHCSCLDSLWITADGPLIHGNCGAPGTFDTNAGGVVSHQAVLPVSSGSSQ